MADVWVVNASPLIALERVGCAPLLARMAREVIIPAGVLAELAAGAKPLAAPSLGPHRSVAVTVIDPLVAAWDLGRGESEVLSLAVATPGAVAIVDDRAARRCAAGLGVATRGTLGVLVEAKHAGLVPAVAPLIEALRASGLFLSDAVIRNALRLAREDK